MTAGAFRTVAAQPFDSRSYPYGAVVLVNVLAGSGGGPGWHGTGVLISPDEVLTAGHIAFRGAHGLATQIEVAPGYQSGAAPPFGVLSGTVTHYNPIPSGGDFITLDDSQSDYAVIHLSQPVGGAPVMAVTPGFAGGTVHVTGYPDSAGGTAMVDDVQAVARDPAFTLLRGGSTGTGSSGGPVWTYGPDGRPQVVGLVSSGDAALNIGYNVQITPAAAAQIAAWVQQDDAGLALPAPFTLPVASLAIFDATAKQAVSDTLSAPFAGTLPYLAEQYVSVTPHSLNIAAGSPNYFIHTGAGNDAVQLLGGTNVVDAGAGSNYLTGGTGRDTFFLDTRGAASDIWDTVSRFGSGDAATVFGIGPGTAGLSWADGQGAPGITGLTLHATAPDGRMASLTLAGFTTADLASGRVSASFGSTGGVGYLLVAAT